jgi:hypothetical protein
MGHITKLLFTLSHSNVFSKFDYPHMDTLSTVFSFSFKTVKRTFT